MQQASLPHFQRDGGGQEANYPCIAPRRKADRQILVTLKHSRTRPQEMREHIKSSNVLTSLASWCRDVASFSAQHEALGELLPKIKFGSQVIQQSLQTFLFSLALMGAAFGGEIGVRHAKRDVLHSIPTGFTGWLQTCLRVSLERIS